MSDIRDVRKEAIEISQKHFEASILFAVEDRAVTFERMYYNQCLIMQALNIVLDDIKRRL